mmetsp:Transcript_32311/g.77223  ORF Transcript_32311/g.77223 Transcript_32311/m.77223 type:complete len:214 (-) Transcript_32311:1060-1701(-)
MVEAVARRKSRISGSDLQPTSTVAARKTLPAASIASSSSWAKRPASTRSARWEKDRRSPSHRAASSIATPQHSRKHSETRERLELILANSFTWLVNSARASSARRARYRSRPGPAAMMGVTAWSMPTTRGASASRSIRLAVLPSLSQSSGTRSTLLMRASKATICPTWIQNSRSSFGAMSWRRLCTSRPCTLSPGMYSKMPRNSVRRKCSSAV